MTRTAVGRDFQSDVMGNSLANGTGNYAPACYMAVSADSSAIAGTETTVPGEIATPGGGLVRGIASFGHTSGASTYTLTKTFTANSTDNFPVTLNKVGILNAAAAGRLVFLTAVPTPPTLNVAGDAATITDTVSL